jgi:hypothetical protein
LLLPYAGSGNRENNLLFKMAGVSEIINVGRIKKLKKCEAY